MGGVQFTPSEPPKRKNQERPPYDVVRTWYTHTESRFVSAHPAIRSPVSSRFIQLYIDGRHSVYFQERPYHVERTTPRPLCGVQRRRATLVLRWETTWEAPVLFLVWTPRQRSSWCGHRANDQYGRTTTSKYVCLCPHHHHQQQDTTLSPTSPREGRTYIYLLRFVM